MNFKIPENVIRRLPRYLRQVEFLAKEGVQKVSSSQLGDQLDATASQIRQDFNRFGGFGQQGYGYNVIDLKEGLSAALGLEQRLTAVIIGVGNLGRALLANFHFSDRGVDLLAAFDVAPGLVGTQVGGVTVLHSRQLDGFLAEIPVDIAVLTLPADQARETSKLLASRGVRGIWNFTGIDIDGHGALVENVHLSDSLLSMSYYIRISKQEGNK